MPRLTGVREGAERPARGRGRLGRWLAEVSPVVLRVTDMLEGRWPNRRRAGLQVALVRCWPRKDGAPELEPRPERPVAVWRWFGWPAKPPEELEGDRIVAAARAMRAPWPGDPVEPWSRWTSAVPSAAPGSGRDVEFANELRPDTSFGSVWVRQVGGGSGVELEVGDLLVQRPSMNPDEVAHGEVLRVAAVSDGGVVLERGYGGSPVEAWSAGSRLVAAGRA